MAVLAPMPERQRDDRHQREAGRAQKRAHRVTKVLQQVVHGGWLDDAALRKVASSLIPISSAVQAQFLTCVRPAVTILCALMLLGGALPAGSQPAGPDVHAGGCTGPRPRRLAGRRRGTGARGGGASAPPARPPPCPIRRSSSARRTGRRACLGRCCRSTPSPRSRRSSSWAASASARRGVAEADLGARQAHGAVVLRGAGRRHLPRLSRCAPPARTAADAGGAEHRPAGDGAHPRSPGGGGHDRRTGSAQAPHRGSPPRHRPAPHRSGRAARAACS